MEKENKAKLVVEIDRSDYDACLFLLGQKKTEETENVWSAMTEEPIVADFSRLDEDENSTKLLMISLAILSVENKVKK